MAKLRKMLGRADSAEGIALMALMDTQSTHTLAAWAVRYAKERYMPLCTQLCPDETRLMQAVDACGEHLAGRMSLRTLQPVLRQAAQAGREMEGPVAQAAARAVATACAAVRTPTSALGALFYGAAAIAYHQAGTGQTPEVYDTIAREEFRRALESLQAVAIPNEQHPAHLVWNC